MALQKNFLHQQEASLHISKKRFIVGIVIGLLYAFAFYSFYYIIRETFRVFSFRMTPGSMWILSDTEQDFYNLFFAFISMISGQAITFLFWFDRPRKIFRKHYRGRVSFVHEQRAMIWYFISWFSRVSLAFGIMFCIFYYEGYKEFSFYPDYYYLFVLIVIVLFLYPWMSIRKRYKKQSTSWFIISLISISILSFGLSKIEIINYKQLNNSLLSRNIVNNYQLQKVESKTFRRAAKPSLVENIYLVRQKGEEQGEEVILLRNQVAAIQDLQKMVLSILDSKDVYERKYLQWIFHIDKDIKMGFINKVKMEFSKIGTFRIGYSADAIKNEYHHANNPYNYSLPTILPQIDSGNHSIFDRFRRFNNFPNQIRVKQLSANSFIVNGEEKNLDELLQLVKNDTFSLLYMANDEVKFKDYFKFMQAYRLSITYRRRLYAIDKYSDYNDNISRTERREVKEKYPMIILELTDEIAEILQIRD